MLTGKDNRKYFRSISDLEVWFCRQGETEYQKAVTKDFSATGLAFTSHIKPDVGEVLKIKLHLKDTDTIVETNAFVVRSVPEDGTMVISIQYYDIDYHDFIKLLDYSLTFHI